MSHTFENLMEIICCMEIMGNAFSSKKISDVAFKFIEHGTEKIIKIMSCTAKMQNLCSLRNATYIQRHM